MLALNKVSKIYKKQTVLHALSHDFGKGATIIIGPSGVGKTTLLRLCATVEKPSSGVILWNGQDIKNKRKAYRNTLGYAPQQIDFPDDITAWDFMAHIGALKNLHPKKSCPQSEELLTRLDLIYDKDKRLQAFSGGMKRRLGLAQAFLGQPECLILDEPTAELDSGTAGKVHDLIFEKAATATILMTTHLTDGLKGYDYKTLELTRFLG